MYPVHTLVNFDYCKAELQSKAKSEVEVAVAGREVKPERHTAVPGVAVPAASTGHAVRA